MWVLFLKALGLLLVFEGILPFLSPMTWRQMMLQACQLSNQHLRLIGLTCMLLGLGVINFVHYFF